MIRLCCGVSVHLDPWTRADVLTAASYVFAAVVLAISIVVAVKMRPSRGRG